MNYPLHFGNYYRFLGWFSLATIVVSLLAFHWTQHFHLDPSFLIWFWLGKELKEKKENARHWAIGISIFALSLFVVGAFLEGGNATFFSEKYPSGSPGYYIIGGIIFMLLVLPGLILLNSKAKSQFNK